MRHVKKTVVPENLEIVRTECEMCHLGKIISVLVYNSILPRLTTNGHFWMRQNVQILCSQELSETAIEHK